MFHSARIKLTTWYLVLIMCVSLSFSLVIYQALNREVDRFALAQRARMEHIFSDGDIFLFNPNMPSFPTVDPDLIHETKQRILLFLIVINSGILFLSGGIGYILAGRTLDPIREMVDEQNRFISDASHELRTPLTAIKSSMEVNLRDPQLTLDEAKKQMKESITHVDRLQSLTDSLLELAQYGQPNFTVHFDHIQLESVIQSALQNTKTFSKEKNIHIKNNIQPTTLQANMYGLTDLFTILLENAIKYSPVKSTITIASKKTDGTIKISVKDQGEGITPKDLPHIFDRFYRADSARSSKGTHGYGLGLAIAKTIVNTHNGSITVKHMTPKGTEFTVVLPIAQNTYNT
jgi:two-component system, OmpR family, sensor histidine kinase CiaH